MVKKSSPAETRAAAGVSGAPLGAGALAELGGRADRARNAGAAQPAISVRILGEILLMVILGEIEFARIDDLGGDGAITLLTQFLLVHHLRGLGGLALAGVEGVDPGAVLGADIVALAHALRRVVALPKRLKQRLVGNLFRIVHHQHHFVVAGAART